MAKSRENVKYKSEEHRKHILILAIILFFIGVVMIFASAYAYYQNQISVTISGTIAAWSFKGNNSTTTFNITLQPSQTSSTLNSTLAPGTSGSFDLVLSTVNSALSADYTITFNGFTNKPSNLKFYSDSAFTTETDITASGYKISGLLNAGSSTTKTIYWKWPYGDTTSIKNDKADAAKNFTFNVSIIGKQHQ